MSDIHEHYWQGCQEGELRIQECDSCGLVRFPPASYCGRCLSPDFHWRNARGTGTLWSWVAFHQVYYQDLADRVPYLVAMVELDEGPLIMTSITNPDAGDMACGARVELEFGTAREGRAAPMFRLVGSEG